MEVQQPELKSVADQRLPEWKKKNIQRITGKSRKRPPTADDSTRSRQQQNKIWILPLPPFESIRNVAYRPKALEQVSISSSNDIAALNLPEIEDNFLTRREDTDAEELLSTTTNALSGRKSQQQDQETTQFDKNKESILSEKEQPEDFADIISEFTHVQKSSSANNVESYFGVETLPACGEVTEKITTHETGNISSMINAFKCPLCSYCAMNPSIFHVHIGGHLKKKPFKCSVCAYRSNWRGDMINHIRNSSHDNGRVLINHKRQDHNFTDTTKPVHIADLLEEDENQSQTGLNNPSVDLVTTSSTVGPENNIYNCRKDHFSDSRLDVQHKVHQATTNPSNIDSNIVFDVSESSHKENSNVCDDASTRNILTQKGNLLKEAVHPMKVVGNTNLRSEMTDEAAIQHHRHATHYYQLRSEILDHMSDCCTPVYEPFDLSSSTSPENAGLTQKVYQQQDHVYENNNNQDHLGITPLPLNINSTINQAKSAMNSQASLSTPKVYTSKPGLFICTEKSPQFTNHTKTRSQTCKESHDNTKPSTMVTTIMVVTFCAKCPEFFVNDFENLQLHLKAHGAKLDLNCSICDFSTKFQTILLSHNTAHTRKYREVSRQMAKDCKACSENSNQKLQQIIVPETCATTKIQKRPHEYYVSWIKTSYDDESTKSIGRSAIGTCHSTFKRQLQYHFSISKNTSELCGQSERSPALHKPFHFKVIGGKKPMTSYDNQILTNNDGETQASTVKPPPRRKSILVNPRTGQIFSKNY